MKIAIIGDIHLATTFRCRIGDFLQDIFDKLNYISDNNDIIICLGDFFDKCSDSISLFNRVYRFLKTLNKKCKIMTIAGNHDLFHHNYDSINKTTLGAMELTGVLTILRNSFSIDNATFDVSPCRKDLSKLGDSDNSKILLGHNYYEMSECPEESFTKEEIKKLNYNTIILGHEHQGYEPQRIGNTILLRPGSLSRITCDSYNETRKIYYYQIDSKTLEYIKLEVPSKPINECFIEGAFNKVSKKQKSPYAGLSALLEKFDKRSTSNLSMAKVLKDLKATNKHISYLRELHRDQNLPFD